MNRNCGAVLGLGAMAVSFCLALGCGRVRASNNEPGTPARWVATNFAAGIAGGEELTVATRGALVSLRGGGAEPELVWEPEAEWRAAAPGAAVGVRHWAVRTDGRWAVRPLPTGTEGYAVASAGTQVWVGHSGGVTVYAPEGKAVATAKGLGPVRVVSAAADGVWALGDRTWALIDAEGVIKRQVTPPVGAGSPWRAVSLANSLHVAGAGEDGKPQVFRLEGERWTGLATPATTGVAASSLAADGEALLLSVPGDALWRWKGGQWARVPGPADVMGDISGISRWKGDLVVSTWTRGAWRLTAGRWTRLDTRGELPVPNIVGVTEWGDRLWAATFDRGLWVRERGSWKRLGREDGLSSDEPRSFAAVPGGLLVRHTSGQIDRFDGRTWQKDVLKWKVARAWSAGLSIQGEIGGWGSVTTAGSNGWEQQILPNPLRAETITGCGRVGDGWALATAKHGVWRLRGEKAQPLPGPVDSWTTSLATSGDAILGGTFAGEAAYWRSPSDPKPVVIQLPTAVTAVCLPEGDTPLAACRSGVWRLVDGKWTQLPNRELAGLEPQALFAGRGGIWVGGRNGLAYLPWRSVRR